MLLVQFVVRAIEGRSQPCAMRVRHADHPLPGHRGSDAIGARPQAAGETSTSGTHEGLAQAAESAAWTGLKASIVAATIAAQTSLKRTAFLLSEVSWTSRWQARGRDRRTTAA
jgi:hypothetical protein